MRPAQRCNKTARRGGEACGRFDFGCDSALAGGGGGGGGDEGVNRSMSDCRNKMALNSEQMSQSNSGAGTWRIR